jgi:AcrR family transcriptional regulator
MARPKTVTDEQMMRAAREVFVEYGPSASVAQIAKRLGVSHAALFSRVGCKEQLMCEALAPGVPEALAAWEGELVEGDEVEWLVGVLMGLMRFFERVVPNLVVLKAAGLLEVRLPAGAPSPPEALRAALSGWLKRVNEARGWQVASPEAVAQGLLGAMEARCFNGYLGGAAFAPGEDEAFIRELVRGLLGQQEVA